MPHHAHTLARWETLTAQAKETIAAEASWDFTLDTLAARLHVSKRLLQQAMAEHCTDYKHETTVAVMQRSAIEMIEGEQVALTARRCGYRSPSAFGVAFKRHFGITPSDYRYAATLYQRIKWRNEVQHGRDAPSGAAAGYGRHRFREDKKELMRILRPLRPVGHQLLQEYARPLHPRRRRLAAPGLVRRRYAVDTRVRPI